MEAALVYGRQGGDDAIPAPLHTLLTGDHLCPVVSLYLFDMSVCTRVCMYVRTDLPMYVCVHTCEHDWTLYLCVINMSTSVWVCMCRCEDVHICVCMFLGVYLCA